MALHIRLRPEERIIINGTVLQNKHHRTIELAVLNKATLLQERDVMVAEQADTALRRLYLSIQLMHIEPEHYETHRHAYERVLNDEIIPELVADDDELHALIKEVGGLLAEKQHVAALKQLQQFVGRPGDGRLLRDTKSR